MSSDIAVAGLTAWKGFFVALFGGVAIELLPLWKLRHQAAKDRPDWIKSPFYYVITTAMILAGGLLTVCYIVFGGINVNFWIAFQLGASVPATIATLGNKDASVD